MKDADFLKQNLDEFRIKEFISNKLKNIGLKDIKLVKTPIGDKVIIFTSRPGLVVGRKGENIKNLTESLQEKFNLDKLQLEISEVTNPNASARIVAERVASSLEKFGSMRFKAIGYKSLTQIMDAGALGAEICITGKVPSARSKRWRFYQGYLKKSGDVALTGVDKAIVNAKLKSGIVGIQVKILPKDIKLPDKVTFINQPTVEEVKEEIIEEKSGNQSTDKKEQKPKKKSTKKKPAKKEATKKKSTKSKPTTNQTIKTEEKKDKDNKEIKEIKDEKNKTDTKTE